MSRKIIDKTRRNILIIYASILLFGALIYAYMSISGHRLQCLLHQVTGLFCPGCGTTRSIMRFLQLDFYHAFLNHPLFFVASIVWFIVSLLAFWGKYKIFRSSKFLLRLLYITVALYLIFTVLRNIPGFEWLQPID